MLWFYIQKIPTIKLFKWEKARNDNFVCRSGSFFGFCFFLFEICINSNSLFKVWLNTYGIYLNENVRELPLSGFFLLLLFYLTVKRNNLNYQENQQIHTLLFVNANEKRARDPLCIYLYVFVFVCLSFFLFFILNQNALKQYLKMVLKKNGMHWMLFRESIFAPVVK